MYSDSTILVPTSEEIEALHTLSLVLSALSIHLLECVKLGPQRVIYLKSHLMNNRVLGENEPRLIYDDN